MGGSSKGTTKNYERELSPQELQLLETQNQMMQQGINIAQQQDDRSQSMYSDWKNNYQGIETGEMSPTANRANGYSNNPNIKTKDEHSKYQSQRAELQKKIDALKNKKQQGLQGYRDGDMIGGFRVSRGSPEETMADNSRRLEENRGSFMNNIGSGSLLFGGTQSGLGQTIASKLPQLDTGSAGQNKNANTPVSPLQNIRSQTATKGGR